MTTIFERTFCAACVSLALAGCAVEPDYTAPATPAPASLTRDALALPLQPGPVAQDWWTVFGSAPLDALVAEALAHSPTVDAARATLRAAQENVAAQRGLFYPQVQASQNNTRQNTGKTQSSPLNSGDTVFNYHTAQLSVAYTPDLFGGNRRQVESLQASAEQQRWQLEGARLTLASNLVGAVLQGAMLAEQVELTDKAVAAMQEQLRVMRNLQRAGYASGLDVATQENLLGQAQQALPPLQKQLEQTRNLVAVLAGRTPDAVLPLPRLAELAPPPLPQAVPSQLVAQRPDVRAAESALHAASASIGVAEAARFPQLSLTAALGGGATDFGRMFSAGNAVWSLGAGLLMPIFDGGTLAARQRAAEAQFDAAAAQYRGAVLTAFQNVADTLYALSIDQRALQVANASVEATRSGYELTRSQLAQGYASRPSLLAAEQAWRQAQAARAAAYGTLLGDSVALYQAVGGGVQP
ncbi:RND efflux system, outer membrane lipoprotein, NodT family [Paracidovorax avenae ATCC 19860]|uniref:RND efflux system, outer membrane lipoprotein, NodT family n=1 Tax=Paracidovorax avenae (strain ATCC 19860 / DSM 7227 / CCUG 15838 / JCM 20985 / LMG 2117 / NCPPB 1011) TaxID=643561 RepID=F0Q8S4_PARA1|nr:efflux transporter outer membrane subunit [Paracidovorax avenae]ADX44742.1 RND efflux system, outer membrane lipoprotein, NodT family [Paracidovorax avenae ATCC 19860]